MLDLSPYLVPAIALLAASVAWAQWHTARSKLVLDLFNLRLAVYNALLTIMGRVTREGTATTSDIVDVARQGDRAAFLFGDDVSDYLASLQKGLVNLARCRRIISQMNGDAEYQQAVDEEAHLLNEHVATFYEKFGRLLRPYMRMHHKKPMWWLWG